MTLYLTTNGTATVKLELALPEEPGETKTKTFKGCFLKNDANLKNYILEYIAPSDDRNKVEGSEYVFFAYGGNFNRLDTSPVIKATLTYNRIRSTVFSGINQKTKTCILETPLVITDPYRHFFLCCDSQKLNESNFLKENSKCARISQSLGSCVNVTGLRTIENDDQHPLVFHSFEMRQCQPKTYDVHRRDYEKLENAGPLILNDDEKKVVGSYRKRSDGKITFSVFEIIQDIRLRTDTSVNGIPFRVQAEIITSDTETISKFEELFSSYPVVLRFISDGSVVFVLRMSSILSMKRLWQSYKDGSLKENLKKAFNEIKELKKLSNGEEIDVELTIDEDEYHQVYRNLILTEVEESPPTDSSEGGKSTDSSRPPLGGGTSTDSPSTDPTGSGTSTESPSTDPTGSGTSTDSPLTDPTGSGTSTDSSGPQLGTPDVSLRAEYIPTDPLGGGKSRDSSRPLLDNPTKTATSSNWSSSTKSHTNFARLCRLLIGGGTQVVKGVFDSIHSPSTLHSILHSPAVLDILRGLRGRKILNTRQWNKLYPSLRSSVTSSGFDITLLFVLLRNICSLTPPATGWDRLPAATDTSREADLARIKWYRNELYAHITETAMSDSDFEKYWKEIEALLVRLGGPNCSNIEDDIERLKVETMDPEDEQYFVKALEEWEQFEQTIMSKLEQSEKTVVSKLEQSLQTMVSKLEQSEKTMVSKLEQSEQTMVSKLEQSEQTMVSKLDEVMEVQQSTSIADDSKCKEVKMETLIGVLLDVSGSMKTCIDDRRSQRVRRNTPRSQDGRAEVEMETLSYYSSSYTPLRAWPNQRGTQDGRGSWARSIFKVVDKLITHDVSSSNHVFALGFGARKEPKAFDLLRTIETNTRPQSEYKNKELEEILEEILSILQGSGAPNVRNLAKMSVLQNVVKESDACLFVEELKRNSVFKERFVYECLPEICRRRDLKQAVVATVLYAADFIPGVAEYATGNSIREVITKGKKILLVLKGIGPSSIMDVHKAKQILKGGIGEDELTEERVDELMETVEPLIYGGTPLMRTIDEAKRLFAGQEYKDCNKLMFIISDGQAGDGNDPPKEELSQLGVTTVCFYITNDSFDDPKRLYSSECETWDETAKLMFKMSSTITTQVIPRAILVKRGWNIDITNNETRLFVQMNHPDIIEEVCDLARDVVCCQDALSGVLSSVSLDLYINQANQGFSPKEQLHEHTCYANASAAVLHLAMHRIRGREGGYPDFFDLQRKIINKYGEHGANTLRVLQEVCPLYRLHCKEVDVLGAMKAITAKRPVIATFRLTDTEWDIFEDFYEENPESVLSKRHLNIKQRIPGEKLGGHAVVLTSYNSEGLRLMNTGGSDWGDGGFFRVSSADVLDLKFVDVFWEIKDLKQSEKDEYQRYGSTIAGDLISRLQGLQRAHYTCPLCLQGSNVIDFSGHHLEAKCPRCRRKFPIKKPRDDLALNLYLLSLSSTAK